MAVEKIKILGADWPNSTANSAHFAQVLGEWAKTFFYIFCKILENVDLFFTCDEKKGCEEKKNVSV